MSNNVYLQSSSDQRKVPEQYASDTRRKTRKGYERREKDIVAMESAADSNRAYTSFG